MNKTSKTYIAPKTEQYEMETGTSLMDFWSAPDATGGNNHPEARGAITFEEEEEEEGNNSGFPLWEW